MPLGVEYELRPLPKPVEILVGEVKQEVNPRNQRPMTVAIEDSYKPELMQDYAYFAPTRTVPMARIYVLPTDAAFQPIVDKIRQHGITVEELKSPLTTEVTSFVVEEITSRPSRFRATTRSSSRASTWRRRSRCRQEQESSGWRSHSDCSPPICSNRRATTA